MRTTLLAVALLCASCSDGASHPATAPTPPNPLVGSWRIDGIQQTSGTASLPTEIALLEDVEIGGSTLLAEPYELSDGSTILRTVYDDEGAVDGYSREMGTHRVHPGIPNPTATMEISWDWWEHVVGYAVPGNRVDAWHIELEIGATESIAVAHIDYTRLDPPSHLSWSGFVLLRRR